MVLVTTKTNKQKHSILSNGNIPLRDYKNTDISWKPVKQLFGGDISFT